MQDVGGAKGEKNAIIFFINIINVEYRANQLDFIK